MKATARRIRSKTAQPESPDAIRARLAAFALATRGMALRRGKVQEPTVRGSVLAGRRSRAAG